MSIYLLFTADILSGYGAAEWVHFGSRWAWWLCRKKLSVRNAEQMEAAEPPVQFIPLAGWVFHGSVVACPSGQRRLWLVERVILPTVSARVGHGVRQVWQREAGSQLQSKHVLWCKQGVSKIKNQPSCGWAKPQGQGRAAVGTGLTYAKSGTAGETVAAAEVCDLWHIFSPVTKLRWTKREVPAGCPGLLRSSLQPTAHRHSGSMAVLCFWNNAQGQDVS